MAYDLAQAVRWQAFGMHVRVQRQTVDERVQSMRLEVEVEAVGETPARLVLLATSVADLRQDGSASIVHALAAIDIGVSVGSDPR
jgi:hypothetical protein